MAYGSSPARRRCSSPTSWTTTTPAHGRGSSSGAIFYDGTQYLRLAHWGGGGRYWNGALDEIDTYDRALSDTEIQLLYQADSGGKCVPPAEVAPTPPTNSVYVDGFEGGDTNGWSSSAVSTAPSGRRFLGQFSTGNNSVSLTLNGLPAHTDLTVA